MSYTSTDIFTAHRNLCKARGYIRTSGSMCVGIGSSETTDYETMFNVLPCDNGTTYPYLWNSTKTATYGVQTNPINWATGSGNRYLNFYAHVANAAYVATYTITVMGN
jgi:hypothetical protein